MNHAVNGSPIDWTKEDVIKIKAPMFDGCIVRHPVSNYIPYANVTTGLLT